MSDSAAPHPHHELLTSLATWLAGGFAPGWEQLLLQLRPVRDEVRIRVVEVREGRPRAKVGSLPPTSRAYADARALQARQADPRRGTWLEATLSITASAGAEPKFTTRLALTTDTEPPPWHEGEEYAATDLVHHLTRFPRAAEEVPEWMTQRITAAGLAVPGLTPIPAPSAPRPTAFDVVVDRDAIPTEGTTLTHSPKVLRLGGSLDLVGLLETIGVPVPFADGQGRWIVRHGASRDDGQVLAVVDQAGTPTAELPAPAEIHPVSPVDPVELVDESGALRLFYCSVPGDLDTVLDAAHLGTVTLPPRPQTAPDNPDLQAAVAAFHADPGKPKLLHVLRQALGGRLIIDATGSDMPEPTQQSANVRLTTMTAPDGSRGMGVFTSNTAMAQFRRKQAEARGESPPARLTGLAQPGSAVLELFQRNEQLRWLIIDPGGPSCAVGRKEVDFALAAPSNRRLKDLLATKPSVQELFTALCAPEGHLFLAETEVDGVRGPALLKDNKDGQSILPAFTSPAEASAYNAAFASRRYPVAAVLYLVLANRAKAIQFNPAGPTAALSASQVWHFLGRPQVPRTTPSGAASTPPS